MTIMGNVKLWLTLKLTMEQQGYSSYTFVYIFITNDINQETLFGTFYFLEVLLTYTSSKY